MKRVKYLILFLFINLTILSQEVYIASFNTLRIGKAQKDYELMSKILEPFDIIGLIEVMSPLGVENLIEELEKESGEKWKYHISPYPVGKSSYKEYFAYIWKSEKVDFLDEKGFYLDEKQEFERPPYGANFRINNFDFTFVLVHSIFGKRESERRAEAFTMDRVYDYFQNLDSEENDIIIAGDFNLSADDEAFENLLNHSDEVVHVLNPRIKTTIGKDKLASSYDNMFLSKIYTQEFEGKSGAIDFTKKQHRMMKDKISDHLPIFIVIDSEFDDD